MLQYLSSAGLFSQYFGNQPMTNGPVYVGIFVLALAILGICLSKGPMRWWLLGVSVLAIFLAWGHNFEWLSRVFIDYVPGYGKFRTPSSILVIVEFTVPLLAMWGLTRIINRCREADEKPEAEGKAMRKALAKTVLYVCGALGAICLLLALFPGMLGDGLSEMERQAINENGLMGDPAFASAIQAGKDLRLGMVSADAWRSFFILVLGTGVVWLFVRKTYTQAWMMVGAATLICLVDLYSVNKRYVNHENFTEVESAEFTPNAADLEILKDKDPNFRVLSMDELGSARPSYFHKSIGGYHAAKLTRYNDLLDRQIKKGNMNVLNMLNTKYLMSMQRNDQGQVVGNSAGEPVWIAERNPEALGNAWWVGSIRYVESDDAEMNALDSLNTATGAVANKSFSKTLGQTKPVAAGDYIKLTEYKPNKLTYKTHSAQGGVAVFSEIYFPWGWTATIDGKEAPIARANYVLRALQVPAGDHTVVFTFDPQSLHVTDTISVVAVAVIYLLLAGALILYFYRKRKNKEEMTNDK